MADEIIAEIVRRTEGVSPAFIKELMRRSVQFHLERNGDGAGTINQQDVDCALDEMLISGGGLNLKLLGATGIKSSRKLKLNSSGLDQSGWKVRSPTNQSFHRQENGPGERVGETPAIECFESRSK